MRVKHFEVYPRPYNTTMLVEMNECNLTQRYYREPVFGFWLAFDKDFIVSVYSFQISLIELDDNIVISGTSVDLNIALEN